MSLVLIQLKLEAKSHMEDSWNISTTKLSLKLQWLTMVKKLISKQALAAKGTLFLLQIQIFYLFFRKMVLSWMFYTNKSTNFLNSSQESLLHLFSLDYTSSSQETAVEVVVSALVEEQTQCKWENLKSTFR